LAVFTITLANTDGLVGNDVGVLVLVWVGTKITPARVGVAKGVNVWEVFGEIDGVTFTLLATGGVVDNGADGVAEPWNNPDSKSCICGKAKYAAIQLSTATTSIIRFNQSVFCIMHLPIEQE